MPRIVYFLQYTDSNVIADPVKVTRLGEVTRRMSGQVGEGQGDGGRGWPLVTSKMTERYQNEKQ